MPKYALPHNYNKGTRNRLIWNRIYCLSNETMPFQFKKNILITFYRVKYKIKMKIKINEWSQFVFTFIYIFFHIFHNHIEICMLNLENCGLFF